MAINGKSYKGMDLYGDTIPDGVNAMDWKGIQATGKDLSQPDEKTSSAPTKSEGNGVPQGAIPGSGITGKG